MFDGDLFVVNRLTSSVLAYLKVTDVVGCFLFGPLDKSHVIVTYGGGRIE